MVEIVTSAAVAFLRAGRVHDATAVLFPTRGSTSITERYM
jgi:hypothetical protein